MSPVCFDAVDKMMDHAVADLITQLVVVHKDVTHRLSFQQLADSVKSCTDLILNKRKKDTENLLRSKN